MYQQLDELRESIGKYAASFDVQELTPEQAGKVVGLCARIEASICSIKTLAAARRAEGDSWKDQGHRSAAHQLADQTGTSPASAKRLLETGRRLKTQPDVARVALAGELSADQLAAVAEGVEADPGKATELIDKARDSSLAELHEEVARTKAGVSDLEARRRQIHARRSLRRWSDLDAAFHAHLYGNPEDGAKLWQALDPIRRRLIMCRRGKQPNEALDAIDYDALMTLAAIATGRGDSELGFGDLIELGLFPQARQLQGAASDLADLADLAHLADPADPAEFAELAALSELADLADPAGVAGAAGAPGKTKKLAGSPVRIMIRVELDTLLRGHPIEGELCEIVGYGPIPVSVIKELAANENAFLVGVLTRAREIVGVYHHRRHPNAHQKSALDFLYPTCAAQGCAFR